MGTYKTTNSASKHLSFSHNNFKNFCLQMVSVKAGYNFFLQVVMFKIMYQLVLYQTGVLS